MWLEPSYCLAHTLQGPYLTQSQGQSPTGKAWVLNSLCLKCSSQDAYLAHSLTSSPLPPNLPEKSWPTPAHSPPTTSRGTPLLLLFSMALSPFNLLTHFTHVVPPDKRIFVCFVHGCIQGWYQNIWHQVPQGKDTTHAGVFQVNTSLECSFSTCHRINICSINTCWMNE